MRPQALPASMDVDIRWLYEIADEVDKAVVTNSSEDLPKDSLKDSVKDSTEDPMEDPTDGIEEIMLGQDDGSLETLELSFDSGMVIELLDDDSDMDADVTSNKPASTSGSTSGNASVGRAFDDGARIPTYAQTQLLSWLASNPKHCLFRFAEMADAHARVMSNVGDGMGATIPTATMLALVHPGWVEHVDDLQQWETVWAGTEQQPHRYFRPTAAGMEALARGQVRYRKHLKEKETHHPNADVKAKASERVRAATLARQAAEDQVLSVLRSIHPDSTTAHILAGVGQRDETTAALNAALDKLRAADEESEVAESELRVELFGISASD